MSFQETFIKYRDKLEYANFIKNWNWKLISEEINLIFYTKTFRAIASKLIGTRF
jgi:hypothetical protein